MSAAPELTAFPEQVLVHIGDYLYGPEISPETEDLHHLSHVCRRFHAIFRDPVNVCLILSSPYRCAHLWHSNLLARLSFVPAWLADRSFLTSVVEFIERHDYRTTSADRRIAMPWAMFAFLNSLGQTPRPRIPRWPIAATYAMWTLLDHFWSSEFSGAPARLEVPNYWREPERARANGVPLAHFGGAAHTDDLWRVYGGKGNPGREMVHPKDIVMLIDIAACNTLLSVSSVRDLLRECDYDPVAVGQMAAYCYPSVNRRLRNFLEQLFPEFL